jgi:hypothetical protein
VLKPYRLRKRVTYQMCIFHEFSPLISEFSRIFLVSHILMEPMEAELSVLVVGGYCVLFRLGTVAGGDKREANGDVACVYCLAFIV